MANKRQRHFGLGQTELSLIIYLNNFRSDSTKSGQNEYGREKGLKAPRIS
jgi:hypothetical protein